MYILSFYYVYPWSPLRLQKEGMRYLNEPVVVDPVVRLLIFKLSLSKLVSCQFSVSTVWNKFMSCPFNSGFPVL